MLQYIHPMIIIKVSDKVEYKIGKLDKKMDDCKHIPKYVITGTEEEED